MALDYTLHLATGPSIAQVTDRLAAAMSPGEVAQRFHTPGLHAGVSTPHPLTRTIIEDAAGFTPALSVWFRTAKDEHRPAGEATMIGFVSAVLAMGDHDAIFLFNGESVILQRRAGRLRLSEDWRNLLAPARLEALPAPLEWAALPRCLE